MLAATKITFPYDMGVVEGHRPDRHKDYAAHYPKGYILEVVYEKDRKTHPGLQKALAAAKAIYQEQGEDNVA